MCTDTHTHTHTHIYIYNVYIYTHTHLIHLYIHIDTFAYVYRCMHTDRKKCIHILILHPEGGRVQPRQGAGGIARRSVGGGGDVTSRSMFGVSIRMKFG